MKDQRNYIKRVSAVRCCPQTNCLQKNYLQKNYPQDKLSEGQNFRQGKKSATTYSLTKYKKNKTFDRQQKLLQKK